MIKPTTTTTKRTATIARAAAVVAAAHSHNHAQSYQNEKVNEICLLSTRERGKDQTILLNFNLNARYFINTQHGQQNSEKL